MDLVTPDEVISWSESNNFPVKSTEFITKAIDYISKQIETYCDREFETTARTEFFDGGETVVNTKAWPINSVTSLWDDPEGEFNSGDELTERDDYVIVPNSGMIKKRSGRFLDGTQSIKVIYEGGFGAEIANVPADLKMACIIQVIFWLRRKDKLHKAGNSVQGITENLLPPVLQKGVIELINPYARVGI